ncbi:hypothetical protein [Candidatus Chlorohelix sp.]|uniref:hypothetical protein n=1 Tax=Candidatus Chlorohelix sp. TaxID=3139201 RepID=UPI003045BDDF
MWLWVRLQASHSAELTGTSAAPVAALSKVTGVKSEDGGGSSCAIASVNPQAHSLAKGQDIVVYFMALWW